MERDEWLRAAWRVMVAEKVDPQRLVFVDEMGANTSLSVVHAWSPAGKRAYCSVPRNRGKNTTLLASMSVEGMGPGPTLAVEGATEREGFEAYLEEVLAPSLRSGQIVVMDNLSSHKGHRVRELIEERGCELLYLPSYSPDLNPIEEAFSKLKGILRKAQARGREALIEAMGRALKGDHLSGRRRLLQTLWISVTGSTIVTTAVYPLYESAYPYIRVSSCMLHRTGAERGNGLHTGRIG